MIFKHSWSLTHVSSLHELLFACYPLLSPPPHQLPSPLTYHTHREREQGFRALTLQSLYTEISWSHPPQCLDQFADVKCHLMEDLTLSLETPSLCGSPSQYPRLGIFFFISSFHSLAQVFKGTEVMKSLYSAVLQQMAWSGVIA